MEHKSNRGRHGKRPRKQDTDLAGERVNPEVRSFPQTRKQKSSAEIARAYRERGWCPIPIPHGEKAPKEPDWQKRTYNVDKDFNGNIGVQLGPRSGGLADVDLDCQEAVALAVDLLPKTEAVFGRHSKPRSHYLYVVDDPEQKAAIRLTDNNNETIIELRLGVKGAQTVFPGSTHPSGELIEWAQEGDPARAPCAVLKAAINKIAVGSLLVRHWPAKGRHEAALRVGGFLARAGWEPEDIGEFVVHVQHAAGVTDSSDVENGRKAAFDAATNHLQGGKGYGLPALVEYFGDIGKKIAEWVEYQAEGLVLDPSDPMRSARELVADSYLKDQSRTLHRWRGTFLDWTGSHYRIADDETIAARIWMLLERALQPAKDGPPKPYKPNCARVGNVSAALGAVTQLDKYIEPPSWLVAVSNKPPANELLACGNGLLHLPAGELHPPTPDYFNISASDVEFNASADSPKQWISFLKQLFGKDKEAIELLQDWFGYCLSPETAQQKILLVVGPKRGGKGTIARILTRLLGRESVAGPTVSSLAENFGLEPLITKPLAIVSDMRIGARTDKSVLVERLLSISGEDTITVPRKFKQAWDGKLPTRFMILTNVMPSLSDGSGALAGRFVVLNLTVSFFGKEDPGLTDKLTQELPSILNWAIEGYRRLRDRGYFIMPESSKAAIEEIEMLGAPIKAFLRDMCELGVGKEVGDDELWSAYQAWSAQEGHKSPGTKTWFGRDLRSAMPGLTTKRPGGPGKRPTSYVGVALKPKEGEPETVTKQLVLRQESKVAIEVQGDELPPMQVTWLPKSLIQIIWQKDGVLEVKVPLWLWREKMKPTKKKDSKDF